MTFDLLELRTAIDDAMSKVSAAWFGMQSDPVQQKLWRVREYLRVELETLDAEILMDMDALEPVTVPEMLRKPCQCASCCVGRVTRMLDDLEREYNPDIDPAATKPKVTVN